MPWKDGHEILLKLWKHTEEYYLFLFFFFLFLEKENSLSEYICVCRENIRKMTQSDCIEEERKTSPWEKQHLKYEDKTKMFAEKTGKHMAREARGKPGLWYCGKKGFQKYDVIDDAKCFVRWQFDRFKIQVFTQFSHM